jgi:hypothetical protein
MSNPKPRRWWLACLLGLLAIGPESIEGQQKTVQWVPATSMSDPRIEVYRQAGTLWERRMGPAREVVDQVCLVPDLPTFFQAIATWDEKHYFPILIDDVESSFRFIRAFKPARIIRMPKAAEPIPADQTWDRAIEAVGASWASESLPASERHRGDEIPKFLGAIPPSAVFSSPDAPMLAGAVALAAGRFQPLFRLDYPKKFSDVLTTQEAPLGLGGPAPGRLEGQRLPRHVQPFPSARIGHHVQRLRVVVRPLVRLLDEVRGDKAERGGPDLTDFWRQRGDARRLARDVRPDESFRPGHDQLARLSHRVQYPQRGGLDVRHPFQHAGRRADHP